MLTLMLFFVFGQFITGLKVYNEEREEAGASAISSIQYINSGHFLQSTFENWESEFLQMAFYIYFTIFLRQMGSAESKDLDKKEEVDRDPVKRPGAPWPVRKGGWILKLYNHSLTIAFAVLFLFSFSIHFYGSMKYYNEIQIQEGMATESAGDYITNPRFWFESFQNWQSEFLAVAAIVLLSIWLRQKGSPESKPVDTPHYENG